MSLEEFFALRILTGSLETNGMIDLLAVPAVYLDPNIFISFFEGEPSCAGMKAIGPDVGGVDEGLGAR